MTINEIENEIIKLQKEINKLKKIEKEEEDEIYLLSIEEYEKYKNNIPLINTWWWLRSPGSAKYIAAGINRSGTIDKSNYEIE